jgi:hypothetical protein
VEPGLAVTQTRTHGAAEVRVCGSVKILTMSEYGGYVCVCVCVCVCVSYPAGPQSIEAKSRARSKRHIPSKIKHGRSYVNMC